MSLSRVRTTKEDQSDPLGQLRKNLGQLKYFLGQLRNSDIHNSLIINDYLLFLTAPHFNHYFPVNVLPLSKWFKYTSKRREFTSREDPLLPQKTSGTGSPVRSALRRGPMKPRP